MTIEENDVGQFYERFHADIARLKETAPDIVRSFGALFQSLMREGALSVREKELVALGIGLAMRCPPCIYLHVQKCLAAGATREQVLEAAGVAVMMQGGPAYTNVPEVMRALDYLESKEGAKRK